MALRGSRKLDFAPRLSRTRAAMADEHDDAVGSIFPVPPPFYKHFTAENLARLKALRENVQLEDSGAATSETAAERSQRILDLPPELRYLVPPSPPTDGKWRNFGGNYDVSSSCLHLYHPKLTTNS